ncbi:gamma-crystallin M2-like [Protopterus annectens]|uniref:gamma-crystallin M2-like n=1 Tax=Protopterus annectens TaxID=7888 RepID=UPI001CF93CCC|nr:gamma-crystallin M2-like [Protopterus annectens]
MNEHQSMNIEVKGTQQQTKSGQMDNRRYIGVALVLYKQIIFYEDKNFQGRFHECSSDSVDLTNFFSRCNSVRVENGAWVIYERPSYTGYQYYIPRGEYPDYHHWMGFNDSIKSCRFIPTVSQSAYKIKIYERDNFGGQMMEYTDDCPSVYDHFHHRDIYSCNVIDGYWMFYEFPNFKGRQYFLRPGEYRKFSDWGATCGTVGSCKRIVHF